MTNITYDQFNNDFVNKNNIQYIIGCDEVGTGSCACELVVCGVKADKNDWILSGINDSKQLSIKKREELRIQLLKLADEGKFTFHIAERSNNQIDEFGLGAMLKDAYVEIFHKLYSDDSLIIADGNIKFDGLGVDHMEIMSLVKADTLLPSVMAASILAKTYRDEKMRNYHLEYPVYGWDKNVGYSTKKHLEAIKKYGLSPLHRVSYKLKILNQ